MNNKMLGRWGEGIAAEFLRKKRYTIIGMGYRTRMGEIDVIAENKKYVVFVEVKLRRDNAFAEAREYVGAEKQRRIIAAARHWLMCHDTEKQPRFDVVEVYAPEGADTKKPTVNWYENAFWTE